MPEHRRLAAIMFTDTVGSTSFAQVDERAALASRDAQEELLRPVFSTHGGRVIKSTGDGFLVEFGSALRAVQCAIEVQQRLRAVGDHASSPRIRIGIHLGDVEDRGDDIVGDSVNIASRIEPLAEPGGICVTDPVFGQVRNKIPERFELLPRPDLKNVLFPLEVYRVVLPGRSSGASADPSPAGLAVLPFSNISPDPSDAYFADGLTEELISVLSQIAGLRVIARTSVTPYRSTSKGVAQIGRELRVSSVLEGSVRKVGPRIRVTAQLIDAPSEGHLWSHTFDRELDDIFAVQSELAHQVADALRVELQPSEEARLESRPAIRSESYLAYLRGRTLMHQSTQASLEGARAEFTRAVELDPGNAAALSGLSDVTRFLGWWFSDAPRAEWEVPSRTYAERAIALDPNLAEAHTSLALSHSDAASAGESNEWAEAEREFRRAIALNPSNSWAHQWFGIILEVLARPEEALVELDLAEQADPLWKANISYRAQLLTWLGRDEEARRAIQRLRELDPEGGHYRYRQFHYLLLRGELPAALEELRRIIQAEEDPRDKAVLTAWDLALSGRREEAIKILLQEESLPERGFSFSELARSYAYAGDLDGCFRTLERSFRSNRLATHLFRLDPGLESVRKDGRFPAFLRKMFLA